MSNKNSEVRKEKPLEDTPLSISSKICKVQLNELTSYQDPFHHSKDATRWAMLFMALCSTDRVVLLYDVSHQNLL